MKKDNSEYNYLKENYLDRVCDNLLSNVKKNLILPRIDRIDARIKEADSFLEKAYRKDVSGEYLYPNPLKDITDIIGVRIITKYKSDIPSIKEITKRYYRYIEIESKQPDNETAFGYFGLHFLLNLPEEIIPDDYPEDNAPKFFELQIKTLFQHAWSEAEHDITYKPSFEWNKMQKRKIAFTAAQAWGADQIFDELYNEKN